MNINNKSYIEIETILTNCLNNKLTNNNLLILKDCLKALNTPKFNNKVLSVNFLKNLMDFSSIKKDDNIYKIIKNLELKTFDSFRYFKTLNNTNTRELFKFVIA